MRDEIEITEQVRSTMASVFGMDETEIPESVSQDSFAAWSSLKHMLLMVGIEEQFGIELLMDEMLNMKSLSKIVSILRGRSAAAV